MRMRSGASSLNSEFINGSQPGVTHGVEREFYAGGDAQLIEDPKQIVPYRMLAEPELHCDLPIGKSVFDEVNDLLFSPGQQCFSRVAENLDRRIARELFQHLMQLGAVGPNLTGIDLLDTTAKGAEPVDRGTNDTIGASTKGNDRNVAVVLLQKYDQLHAGRCGSYLRQRIKAIGSAIT